MNRVRTEHTRLNAHVHHLDRLPASLCECQTENQTIKQFPTSGNGILPETR